MSYRCEMLYQILHTCVIQQFKQTHPVHWILMSPASQICLVVESPASFDRVTCLPPKNASAPWGGVGSRQLTIIVWQVSYVQYLLACQKSQRSTPYNIVKSGLPWKRVFRRRHLGRRVTAVTCLRWPTVDLTGSAMVLQLQLIWFKFRVQSNAIITVQYNNTLHTSSQELRQNINLRLNPQNTQHTLP